MYDIRGASGTCLDTRATSVDVCRTGLRIGSYVAIPWVMSTAGALLQRSASNACLEWTSTNLKATVE
jgi:hypothetical protein